MKAITSFPFPLQRATASTYKDVQVYRYHRRGVDASALAQVLAACDSPHEKFGDWDQWGDCWIRDHIENETTEPESVDVSNFAPTTEPDSDTGFQCTITLSMDLCAKYLDSGSARRPDQIKAFMQRVFKEGQDQGSGIWKFTDAYFRKTVAGEPFGRAYGSWLSLQALEKELRAILFPHAYGLDIKSSFVHASVLNCEAIGMEVPKWLGKLKSYGHEWQDFIR